MLRTIGDQARADVVLELALLHHERRHAAVEGDDLAVDACGASARRPRAPRGAARRCEAQKPRARMSSSALSIGGWYLRMRSPAP